MAGQHLPADHSRGDANTVGGYAAVHGRPAAFEGTDGLSYSVEIVASPTGEPERPWGAYLLFVQWGRIGGTGGCRHDLHAVRDAIRTLERGRTTMHGSVPADGVRVAAIVIGGKMLARHAGCATGERATPRGARCP